MAPKAYQYSPGRPDEGTFSAALKELASQYRRFGYRRLHLLLCQREINIDYKNLFRIYH